jgi:hypothetical protein
MFTHGMDNMGIQRHIFEISPRLNSRMVVECTFPLCFSAGISDVRQRI